MTISINQQFFTSMDYYGIWGNPTCQDVDSLTIEFYSTLSKDPLITLDVGIANSLFKPDCLYE
uniref:Uncharacterized protein n=1 Tax=Bracon brevicornis TaxID=1563983 RepID=A0A6V7JIZ0_9HYME